MALIDVRQQMLALLNRKDCSNNLPLATTFLSQGLARIQRLLRIPSMERATVLAATLMPTQSFEVPVDLLQIMDIIATDNAGTTVPLEKKAWRQIQAMGFRVGCLPQYYARVGASIFLFPFLPIGSTVTMTYYGTFKPLAADTDENEVTLGCPDLFVYAALAFAADYFQMDQADAWENRFTALMQEVQDEANQLDLTGGPSVVSSAYGDYT